MARTVVALFDHAREAEGAVRELTASGFRGENISFAGIDQGSRREEEMMHDAVTADGAAVGATGGAILGGIGGLLLGLGAFAIPGFGPLAAAGPIVAAITGAGVGAGLGGVAGALTEAGVPEEEAQFYAEGIRRGGTVVAVHQVTDRDWTAEDILRRYGAVDVEKRKEDWTRAGGDDWAGLERLPSAPANRAALEREPAVASSAILERPAAPSAIPDQIGDTEHLDQDFQSHFQQHYATSGRPFDDLRPAYEYGYHAGSDPRYSEGEWTETEAGVRQEWSTRGQGSWDEVKDAVRCGWNASRGGRVTGSQAGTVRGAADARGPFEKAEDSVTGDQFDDKTGKRI